MGSSIYPLSPERRAYYEKIATAAEPYEDMADDEYILDDMSPRGEATNARFTLKQDDMARAKLDTRMK